jgi:hypothetical protein
MKRIEENQTAPDQKLFSALEMFVNCGDSLGELRSFRKCHPSFFPPEFYEQSEWLAATGRNDFFNWYKRLLRMVWEGRDPDGIRLSVLMGIREPSSYIGAPTGDYAQEAVEHNDMRGELVINRSKGAPLSVPLRPAQLVPRWRTGEVQYVLMVDFQRAVYLLMQQSWRAKICLIDSRYFVAAKPHNLYCSPMCAATAKRKRDLQWWRREGSQQQKAARKSRRKK